MANARHRFEKVSACLAARTGNFEIIPRALAANRVKIATIIEDRAMHVLQACYTTRNGTYAGGYRAGVILVHV